MNVRLVDFDPQKIADSGQCFRMHSFDNYFKVIASNRYLEIYPLGNEMFEFSCTQDDYENFWQHYFDLNADYSLYRTAINPNDSFLIDAAAYGYGIRILYQDLWETTVSFIISQRKNIPAIQTCINALCCNYGTPLQTPHGIEYAFPTPEQLHSAHSLQGCALGYREKYVLAAAQQFSSGSISFEQLKSLSFSDARNRLLTLYGVGKKVADCIMLFSLHDIEAFPIDVWIQRIIDREYGGSFTPPPYGGVIQQYMFYYARNFAYAGSKRLASTNLPISVP